MKLFLIAALMIAGIAPAWATDYVLVYYPKGNVTYTCKLLPSYIDTEGRTRLDFNQCDVFSTDLNDYGPFPFMPVKLTMSGPAFKLPNVRHCSFVAQANGVADTSHVVDCR
jgi:hypothetical protein